MAANTEINVRFPGGRRVVAELDGYEIPTDQPVDAGGEGSAPSPYQLFVASIGACAGFFALSFFQKRGLATDGLRVTTRTGNVDGTLGRVMIDVALPAGFPEKYRDALLRSIEQCSVKRAILAQPAFEVRVGDEWTTAPVAVPA